jgi:CheY-like chemotaxis protein
MLSSDNVNLQLSRLREAGLDTYLIKPITRRELFESISHLLAKSNSSGSIKFAGTDSAAPRSPVELPCVRILIAEDSPDNQLVVSAFLRRTPCQLDFAENGEVAFEKFTHEHYDLVLMVMQMPVMDGYKATRSIRDWEQQHNAPHTNIIALTASALDEDLVKARKAGCDVHLAKPIKKAILLEAIRKYAAQPARSNGVADGVRG